MRLCHGGLLFFDRLFELFALLFISRSWLWPGSLYRDPGLVHPPTDLALRVRYVELFEEMVLSKSRTPDGYVIASFFRRFVECFSELLEVFVIKSGRSS